jgi:Ca2+-binding RTX toxin-like protein
VVENANEGNDTVYATADFRLSANIENLILQGTAHLQGYGNGLANTLYGNFGNNILDGDAGADGMIGGAGNDVYYVDNASDAVSENANEGTDTVSASINYMLGANVENLTLTGTGGTSGTGNSGNNSITGNSGNNVLDGGVGADTMAGGAGNDAYLVDNGGDAVIENANEGSDTVYASIHYRLTANVENLVLQGGADLQAYGNSLANAIYGNSGNNLLNGDAGADIMSGGTGNDAYFVDNAGDAVLENPNGGNETIYALAHFRLAANL